MLFSNWFHKKEKHVPIPKGELVRGSKVLFGSYYQEDNMHKTPIEWMVLDVQDDTALLMSSKALVVSGYCDSEKVYKDVKYLEYSNSLARKICNEDFYDSAFSDEEKQCMLSKEIREIEYDSICKDNVFLLSEKEVCRYLPYEEQRKCEPTKYVKNNGARMGWSGDEAYTGWWLLPEVENDGGQVYSASGTPCGGCMIYPKAVFHNGIIGFHSRNVYHSDFAIRPCILIRVPKRSYKKYNLEYIKSFIGKERTHHIGEGHVYHDVVLEKWRYTVQLDEEALYFLSVFIHEDGTFENYCLDVEAASDSHYEFLNEENIRKIAYVEGDEELYLDEILTRYLSQHGSNALLNLIYPNVTAQFHFD